jgi:hypothetical protein
MPLAEVPLPTYVMLPLMLIAIIVFVWCCRELLAFRAHMYKRQEDAELAGMERYWREKMQENPQYWEPAELAANSMLGDDCGTEHQYRADPEKRQ